MNTYIFDLGNSTVGPVGVVLELQALNKRAAVKRAKEILANYEDGLVFSFGNGYEVRFYTNPKAIRMKDCQKW